MALLLVFLLLCLPFIPFLLKIIQKRSKHTPPGPLGLPFIGNWHQIPPSSFHTYLWQLSKSYGPIVSLNFGFVPAIVISSANSVKEVLKTQDIIFCNRPPMIGQQKLSYNGLEVIFSLSCNDYWREMKKVLMLHLLSPKRVESFRYIREDEVSRAMKKIHYLALSSMPVNLSELMKSAASNLILRVGFRKTNQDEDVKSELLGQLYIVQEMMADFFISDMWRGLPFVGLVDRLLGKTDKLDKCFKYFDVFYQELIDEHLDSRNPNSHEKGEDFIDILLRLKEEKVVNLTYDHIKGLLMDILVAATDTSTATVIWAMTALVKNPKAMKKIQEEVRNVAGKKGKVDEDDLPKLTYFKAVVKEIFRLYPPTPLLVPRETNKDTMLHGYKIKAKTLVLINVLAIGRDPETWERPEEFLPERFLDSNIDFRGNDFELIPFGAGRRICPGISMGVGMVDLLLANLVYLFDWGLPPGMNKEDIDFDVMPGLTMHKLNDLCLSAHVY